MKLDENGKKKKVMKFLKIVQECQEMEEQDGDENMNDIDRQEGQNSIKSKLLKMVYFGDNNIDEPVNLSPQRRLASTNISIENCLQRNKEAYAHVAK